MKNCNKGRDSISTSVGHALAGASILLTSSKRRKKLGILQWVVVFLLANLPDVDFLFGYVAGNPSRYHHLWTHSLTFAIGIGVLF